MNKYIEHARSLSYIDLEFDYNYYSHQLSEYLLHLHDLEKGEFKFDEGDLNHNLNMYMALSDEYIKRYNSGN